MATDEICSELSRRAVPATRMHCGFEAETNASASRWRCRSPSGRGREIGSARMSSTCLPIRRPTTGTWPTDVRPTCSARPSVPTSRPADRRGPPKVLGLAGRLQQPALVRQRDHLGAAGRVELRDEVRHVHARRLRADVQRSADLPIRESLREQREHVTFAGGEQVGHRRPSRRTRPQIDLQPGAANQAHQSRRQRCGPEPHGYRVGGCGRGRRHRRGGRRRRAPRRAATWSGPSRRDSRSRRRPRSSPTSRRPAGPPACANSASALASQARPSAPSMPLRGRPCSTRPRTSAITCAPANLELTHLVVDAREVGRRRPGRRGQPA